MNDEEMLAVEELERDIETLQEFLKEKEPKAPESVEPEPPVVVAEAPKPKPKSKSKPKAKAPTPKVEEKVELKPAPKRVEPAQERLYGAAKLRAKRGR